MVDEAGVMKPETPVAGMRAKPTKKEMEAGAINCDVEVLKELERLCHSDNALERAYWQKHCINYRFSLHSANPVGVANMRAIIQANGWKEVR